MQKALKEKFVNIDGDKITVGRQVYLFDPEDTHDRLDDVLENTFYNKKTYIYPQGTREIFSNTWTFHVSCPHKKKTLEENHKNPYMEFMKSLWFLPAPEKSEWEKRKESDKRAVRKIEDIILLNPDMRNFVTLTFDLNKVQSNDRELVANVFTQWLKNQTYRKGLKYVFVPEYHEKDNKIHFHGVINDALTFVDSGTRKVNGFHKPVRLSKIIRWLKAGRISEADIGSVVYNVAEWQYGFSTAAQVEKSIKNVVLYVTKYITKDVMGKNKIFGKRYWSSRNVETLPPIKLENVSRDTFESLQLKEYKSPYDSKSYKYRNNMTERKE